LGGRGATAQARGQRAGAHSSGARRGWRTGARSVRRCRAARHKPEHPAVTHAETRDLDNGFTHVTVGEDRFREVFNRVERVIEDRYGLPVAITDVTDPFSGDLDG